METESKAPVFLVALVGLFFCIFAPTLLSEYGLHIAIVSLFYVLMSSSWNLVAGFTGQVSFAQAAFASMGAYASGLIASHWGLPLYLTVPIAGLIAGVFGFFLGGICLPLGGKYLSLVTLGFSEIFRIIVTNEDQWTRGTQGLQLAPLFESYSKTSALYLFMIATVVTLILIRLLVDSDLGLKFKAVMNDEIGARSLGVSAVGVRTLAFTLSSLISAVAGALYGHYLTLATPDMGSLDQMFLILVMVIVGGKGTWLGPVLGAVILEVLSEQIRFYGEYSVLVFGIVALLMIRFRPQGLVGKSK